MANLLTTVRETIEGLFDGQLTGVVEKFLRYNSRYAINVNDPSLHVRRFLVIQPMGGPTDPHWSSQRSKLTRRFMIGFNNPAGDMDLSGLEDVEAVALKCIVNGIATLKALSGVEDVRWTTGDYALYSKSHRGSDEEEQEMWTSFARVEVDLIVSDTEIASWTA